MKQLWGAIELVRSVRLKLQFGELSRAPIKLIRFHLEQEMAECDWIARQHDVWDEFISEQTRLRHASEQALRDAIAIRGFLFAALPDVQSAALRVYRDVRNELPELVIAGIVDRTDQVANVQSTAMKARLCGLRFWMDDGVLCPLSSQEAVLR